jgi:hypothetical protein
MDVHKKSWSVSILTDTFEHKTFTQPPEVGTLVNYLNRNFPGASYKSVYCGFWIHDRLQEHGVQCLVVNPADVPTKDKERTKKTDRVDCRKLARSLRSRELQGIYVPCRPKVEDRSLIRTRYSMVKKRFLAQRPAVKQYYSFAYGSAIKILISAVGIMFQELSDSEAPGKG